MPAHPTVQPHTTAEQLDRALADLNARREAYSKLSLASRIELVDSCIEGVSHVARPWVDVACRAKGIPAGSPLQAEEIFAGPVATLRYLILLRQSLCDIQQQGKPALPAAPCLGTDQRVYVPVVPARGLYDRLAFPGFRVTVRMQPDVTLENLSDHIATYYQSLTRGPASIALVLGAGNVSSIPPTDAFSKLFQEGSLVLLKMNPVNAYLGPLFEQAFSQLIQNGYLRLVYGGAEVGATAVAHPLVNAVHITGSVDSHERIVWGPPGKDTEKRRRSGQPLLKKSITSELGNVSPWIVVPGKYSQRQLAFQARNVAASVTNNASFNCVATKVLLSWREWPDRQRFLDLLQQTLQKTPRRVAYYPGAGQRFERFTGTTVVPEDDQTLPWTLLGDVQPAESPHLLQEESFACVFAEVALDASHSPDLPATCSRFCKRATVWHVERDRDRSTNVPTRIEPGSARRLRATPEIWHDRYQSMARHCLRLDEPSLGRLPRQHTPGYPERQRVRAQHFHAQTGRKNDPHWPAHGRSAAALVCRPHAGPPRRLEPAASVRTTVARQAAPAAVERRRCLKLVPVTPRTRCPGWERGNDPPRRPEAAAACRNPSCQYRDRTGIRNS